MIYFIQRPVDGCIKIGTGSTGTGGVAMPGQWRDELAAKIAALRGEDWERTAIVNPAAFGAEASAGFQVLNKDFEAEVGPCDPDELLPLVNRVNDQPFAGAAAGCLMFLGFVVKPGAAPLVRFVLRDRPWNELLTLDGEWREYRDAAGAPIFPGVDFSAIP